VFAGWSPKPCSAGSTPARPAMIEQSINKAFSMAKSRGWDHIYVAVDIHDTMVVSTYKESDIPKTFFPNALATMQYLSSRPDIVLILYSSSFPNELVEYLNYFKSQGIRFKFVNENPAVTSKGYGYFEQKFYFNVLIEDKAGFNAETDWSKVYDAVHLQQPLRYE
jgi:hypothetical protein